MLLLIKKLGIWLGIALLAVYLVNFQTYQLPLYHQNFIGELQPFGPLTAAHPFTECLTLPSKTRQIALSNFQILMATYARKNTNYLIFNFYDGNPSENQPLEQFRFSSELINDNKPLTIPLQSKYDSMFCFKISTIDKNPSQSPTIWLNQNNRSIVTLTASLTFTDFLRGLALERNLPFLLVLGSGILYLLASGILLEKLLRTKPGKHHE